MDKPASTATGSDVHDELSAIRSRELDLKRNRGAIACAECRRCVEAPHSYADADER